MNRPAPRKFLARQRFQYKLRTERRAINTTLQLFNAAQLDHGVTGAVGEIGVADGLFFIPLAQCRRPGECAAAIDVFDDFANNWNEAGGYSSVDILRTNITAVLGSDDGVAYIKGDTLGMTGEAILARTGGQRFRLFSIDGAHSTHHTLNDLNLAADTVAPGGVVFLDDIRNWGWPGVIDGLARYMLLQRDHKLVPFFLYEDKLLMTTPESHAHYLECARAIAPQVARTTGIVFRVSEFFGHNVLGY